ncbi:MAG: hypothetical protein NTZ14_16215 [Hyphomicrobiales bacterium]|nr:hypothetical protein [Hyphomicrobiales bacterium]
MQNSVIEGSTLFHRAALGLQHEKHRQPVTQIQIRRLPFFVRMVRKKRWSTIPERFEADAGHKLSYPSRCRRTGMKAVRENKTCRGKALSTDDFLAYRVDIFECTGFVAQD